MWTNKEFVDKYLRPLRLADRWDKLIYPAMKDAIICSMLVAQDSIDQRKVNFMSFLIEKQFYISFFLTEFI